MEKDIINILMTLSVDTTTANGIPVQMLNYEQAQVLLNMDPDDEQIHECILQTGRFLFESENGKLKTIYRVI